jgi:hypothetical protein
MRNIPQTPFLLHCVATLAIHTRELIHHYNCTCKCKVLLFPNNCNLKGVVITPWKTFVFHVPTDEMKRDSVVFWTDGTIEVDTFIARPVSPDEMVKLFIFKHMDELLDSGVIQSQLASTNCSLERLLDLHLSCRRNAVRNMLTLENVFSQDEKVSMNALFDFYLSWFPTVLKDDCKPRVIKRDDQNRLVVIQTPIDLPSGIMNPETLCFEGQLHSETLTETKKEQLTMLIESKRFEEACRKCRCRMGTIDGSGEERRCFWPSDLYPGLWTLRWVFYAESGIGSFAPVRCSKDERLRCQRVDNSLH